MSRVCSLFISSPHATPAAGPPQGAPPTRSTLAVLGLFFAYFAAANASFAAGTIAVDDVPAELRRWSAWQWARTACGVGAFIAGIAALRRTATTGQLAT